MIVALVAVLVVVATMAVALWAKVLRNHNCSDMQRLTAEGGRATEGRTTVVVVQQDDRDRETARENAPSTDPPKNRGMSLRALSNLPVRIHGSEAASMELDPKFVAMGCAICMSEFKDGAALRLLPCGHTFHYRCVDKWLAQVAQCPLCKRSTLPTWTGQEKPGADALPARIADPPSTASVDLSRAQGAMGAVTMHVLPTGESNMDAEQGRIMMRGVTGSIDIANEEETTPVTHAVAADAFSSGAIRDVLNSNALGEALWDEEERANSATQAQDHGTVPGMVT